MKNCLYLSLCLFILNAACAGKTDQDVSDLLEISDAVVGKFWQLNDNFATPKTAWGTYTNDLVFEGMLAIDRAAGKDIYLNKVLQIMRNRGLEPDSIVEYRKQPFGCITFELYRATRDERYVQPFVAESIRFHAEITRTSEGAICLSHKGSEGRHVLIDYLQEYASRMAKLGYFTGDDKYYEECVAQFEIYRKLLRDPKTGLYSQGRGWLDDPMELSPGAWSRGHGWLIRGMVRSLEFLPEESDWNRRLTRILDELANDLLKVQDDNGMWHQLLHLPFEDSYPESSGTAFIAYYLSLAIDKGYLDPEPYEKPLEKAFCELKKYVSEDGDIYGTCEGPGPLYSIDNWYRTPAKPNDKHGFGTYLFAIAGEILFKESNQVAGEVPLLSTSRIVAATL